MLSRIMRALRRLVVRDEGGVTVEWVALAAAIVVGAVAIANLIFNGLGPPAKAIGTTLTGAG